MKNKDDGYNEPKRLLSENVVLPEVYDELEETGKPVKVICQMNKKSNKKEVFALLKKVEVESDTKDSTDYYVFVTINREQAKKIEEMEKKHEGKENQRKSVETKAFPLDYIWLDKKMKAYVDTSQRTINAEAARNLFKVGGEGIIWAVLDTGINSKHKWFNQDGICLVVKRTDFSGEGFSDVGLHGTHVAGIIARIVPQVRLYDYKVLGRDGGTASMVIRAMEKIRKINFKTQKMVIHGVNLSLGGPVPVGSYGCGWSPECQEANRLMASGVVVCVAAGNEGHQTLAAIPGKKLHMFKTFVDVCISDPANAEEVITVGSTHKTKPHSYGASYFSSKGPTGDGRSKPDCLAPGEKIESADARTKDGTIAMDGTSMATPHVSGAIALFLSTKPEFIGQTQRIKQILLNSCTDLKRDRYFQGAGLVDVLRMIQSV